MHFTVFSAADRAAGSSQPVANGEPRFVCAGAQPKPLLGPRDPGASDPARSKAASVRLPQHRKAMVADAQRGCIGNPPDGAGCVGPHDKRPQA